MNLFADDSIIWEVVTDPIVASKKLDTDLTAVQNWASKWHMSLNPDKTEILTISTKTRKLQYPDLFLNGNKLKEVSSHKHLGLTLTSDMTWTTHVNAICTTAGQRINILRKMSYHLSRKSIELLYFSYIRPIIEYAGIIFGNQTLAIDAKLENIQTQAALICTGSLFNTNRENLLNELGWPSLSDRRSVSKLSLTHKALNNQSPEYISHIFNKYTPNNSSRYCLRNTNRLILPIIKTERLKRSFFPSASTAWNAMNEKFVNIENHRIFKTSIKSGIAKPRPPSWFLVGKRHPNILMTRLRLNNSMLNGDRFRYNLIADPSHPATGHETASDPIPLSRGQVMLLLQF